MRGDQRAALLMARETITTLYERMQAKDAYIDELEAENEMLKRVCEDWYMKHEYLAMRLSGHIGVPPVNHGSVSG